METSSNKPKSDDLLTKRIRFAGWIYLFTGPVIIAFAIVMLVFGRNQRLNEQAGHLLVMPGSTTCFVTGAIALVVGWLLWRQGTRNIRK
jgi:hypothetical protein